MTGRSLRGSGRTHLVAGLDLGSTELKLLVMAEPGEEPVTLSRPTPWVAGPGGTTEMAATDLLLRVRDLLAEASERLVGAGQGPVEALGIAGMGETGVLVDRNGEAVAPAFAWFDPRGAQQAAAFPAEVRQQFSGRTGLPLGAQVSVAKLAHLRDGGLDLRGLRWLNLPEFVAMSLGGRVALEHSLTCRTGLIDQDRDEPWGPMLDVLGVTASFLPERVDAGTSFGAARGDLAPGIAGAALTVAGHDHLVAAEAGRGLPDRHYHVSLGTAEVLLRVIDGPLGYDARARLAGALVNEVRHVRPGKRVLVAGVKTGLLLRRALQLAGINDRPGRDRLDADLMRLPYEGALADGAIEVRGARNDDGNLRLTVRTDGASPAEVFGAVLRHSNDEIRLLIAAMDRELPPAVSSTLTGGWTGMAGVRRARERVLPGMTVSEHEQATALGAAQTALRLLVEPTGPDPVPTPAA